MDRDSEGSGIFGVSGFIYRFDLDPPMVSVVEPEPVEPKLFET